MPLGGERERERKRATAGPQQLTSAIVFHSEYGIHGAPRVRYAQSRETWSCRGMWGGAGQTADGRRQTADGAGGGDAEIATKGCDAG